MSDWTMKLGVRSLLTILLRWAFDYNQYAVYRHYDQDHDHVHVVASRIKLDGSCVHDSWDYRRSEGVFANLKIVMGWKQL
jgi:hypothetical protein